MERLIRLRDLLPRIGLKRTSVYKLVAQGKFPQPVKLTDGPRGPVAWKLSDIEAWIAARQPARAESGGE